VARPVTAPLLGKHPCMANILCRDMQSIRSCLTYFSKIMGGGTLDFTKLTFIDAGAMVLLHQVVRARSPSAANVFIDLPKLDVPRGIVEDNLARQSGNIKMRNPNSFPLRYIPTEDRLVPELRKWREMLQNSTALGDERARRFSSNMSEVLMNSFTHAKTRKPCIVAGQTFRKKKHTLLAAVDYGDSIPTTLAKSGRYGGVRKPEEWMLMALEEGVTCKSRETNRGIGLFTLQKMIRENRGSMYLVSGEGTVSIEDGSDPVGAPLGEKYGIFPGTLLILDIKTSGE
jgi:hypothetical protein